MNQEGKESQDEDDYSDYRPVSAPHEPEMVNLSDDNDDEIIEILDQNNIFTQFRPVNNPEFISENASIVEPIVDYSDYRPVSAPHGPEIVTLSDDDDDEIEILDQNNIFTQFRPVNNPEFISENASIVEPIVESPQAAVDTPMDLNSLDSVEIVKKRKAKPNEARKKCLKVDNEETVQFNCPESTIYGIVKKDTKLFLCSGVSKQQGCLKFALIQYRNEAKQTGQQIVHCLSRNLTDAEKEYGSLELEGLALAFGMENCNNAFSPPFSAHC